MFASSRISKVFATAKQVNFNHLSKIIIISDCHKGDGNWDDDFAANQNIYFHALTYYYNNNYTYIDLGDSEELWKNKNFSKIANMHNHIFWLLNKFYLENRLYFIYGNHDMVKKNKRWLKNNYNEYFDTTKNMLITLFKDAEVYSGIVLNNTDTENKILLLHGHQADFFNDTLWQVSRFLVRYLWKPLELLGVHDPTGAAKNYEKMNNIENTLKSWVKNNNQMLIAGHTHRPVFPEPTSPPYFNDGSCIHPRCITGIEIVNNEIMLIKWSITTKYDGTLIVSKDILEGPSKLENYFNKN